MKDERWALGCRASFSIDTLAVDAVAVRRNQALRFTSIDYASNALQVPMLACSPCAVVSSESLQRLSCLHLYISVMISLGSTS